MMNAEVLFVEMFMWRKS